MRPLLLNKCIDRANELIRIKEHEIEVIRLELQEMEEIRRNKGSYLEALNEKVKRPEGLR